MKTMMRGWLLIAFGLLFPVLANAESGAYGFRIYQLDWKEDGLFGDTTAKEDGTAFGPSFLFRLGEGDTLGLGFDGYYFSAGDLDRAELDGHFIYSVSEVFDVSLELRHSWYDYQLTDGNHSDKIGTSGTGVGLGLNFQVPLGESGIIGFGSTRGLPMNMSTDQPGVDNDWTFLWLYEFGLAYAQQVNFGVADSSIYIAAGYRHQQNKGGDYDETVEMPFLEFGLRQEF